MKPQKHFFYKDFTSRNWAFITNELQKKIKKTNLFIAGCGLGSIIAELAARTGFENFVLADGDKVEVSNLNRQAFLRDHIGINKASATKSIILNINPNAKIKVFNGYIKPQNISELIKKTEFLINTVDFGPVYIDLTRTAQKRHFIAIHPFNIGYGGVVLVFDSKTPKIENMFCDKKIHNEVDFYLGLLQTLNNYKLPHYLRENLESIFSEMGRKKYNPQIGIASNITAAITITTILKLLSGAEVPKAPTPIYRDFLSYE